MMSNFGVIVASSELGSRLYLGSILTRIGLDPICVSSLHDCHESIVRKNIDLVFCDPRLTDGTYIDLLAAYRRKQRKPRIVVTSPSADWEEFKEAVRWGAFDIVSSPCRPMDVEWVVIQAKRDEKSRQKFQTTVPLRSPIPSH
jgi:DNA-binding NtrC family response regulator